MCSQKDKNRINQFNRSIIALAGLAGALLDGFHSGDLLCIFSMLFWLWQNEFSVLEERCVDQLKRLKLKNSAALPATSSIRHQ